ncbi:DNA/RNA non-specific endonuclease [Flavobacterium columnare]|uniref:DNA/RNA non-specific endonuclease n=2 Tax=Flavobacterium TaxID=237 RepID=A0ABW8PRC4_9FLAO|nr:DNA/RNA non-specific endonuclease [Flavobacterium columnare]SPE76838.1 Nuclease precursor [Flavobacterium columnare]
MPIFILFIFLELIVSSCKNKKEIKENNPIYSKIDFNFLLPLSKTGQIIHHKYYTLSYSEKDEQAEWVAYWLNRKDIVYIKYKRPHFVNDPMVEEESANWKNYISSGYERGHLCPAGDRKFSKEAFEETFYTSNIAPQKSNFNGGIWNRLEQKARYWAKKYDGLYVVTGGVLSGKLKHIGRENVTVPDFFYKVLLNKRNDRYQAIAFLIPHQDSDRPLYEFVVSIDEIEELTGIDFFSKLSDAIEDKLESNQNYNEWCF